MHYNDLVTGKEFFSSFHWSVQYFSAFHWSLFGNTLTGTGLITFTESDQTVWAVCSCYSWLHY